MITKKILLIGLSLAGFNLSTQAVVNCATDCTKETACRFSFKVKECEKTCPNFKADICNAKATAPSSPVPVPAEGVVTPNPVVSSTPPQAVQPNAGAIQPSGSQPPALTTRPRAQRAAPPLPRPLPNPPLATPPVTAAPELPVQSPQPSSQLSSAPHNVQKSGEQNNSLANDQIEMLTEVNRVANICESKAYDTAKKAALEPQAYDNYLKFQSDSGEAKEVFPKQFKSIFPNNTKYCAETIDPQKMDHQSFVSYLKNQVSTTKTMQADILRKILGWNDKSKLVNYKNSVSGDLRALSSFCSAPITMLESAIQSRLNTPQKKPGIFRQLKNQVIKKGEK